MSPNDETEGRVGDRTQHANRAKTASSLKNTKIEDENGENYNPDRGVVRPHDGVKKTNSEDSDLHASCSIP